jgi:transcriptional regulator with XRE-family HTH domain
LILMTSAPTDAEIVGRRILGERLKADTTQSALAQLTGIPQTTISGYERGEYEPSLRNATLIAHVLDIKLDDLADPFRPRPSSRRRPQLTQVAS